MPIIPCNNRITCEGVDTPVSNFSSEAPDLFDFRAFSWVLWNPNFPIGPDLSGRDTGDMPIYWAQGCEAICLSLTSQEDANACAQRQSYLCGRGNEDNDGVVPILYSNAAQTCTALCADGSPFTYTVPAGWIVTTSQSLSDQAARGLACALANNQMVCLSAISEACVGNPYNQIIAVTRGLGPFVFTLVSGVLPPGITFSQVDSSSALLSGTPTTAGNYTFRVLARSVSGPQVTRTYRLSVLGITNFSSAPAPKKNVAYSFQLTAAGGSAPYTFTVAAGALPAGLTLSSTGLISGTPTAVETANFVLQILDSSSGAIPCQKVASLAVTNPVSCPTLINSINIVSATGQAVYASATGEILHPNKVYAIDGFNQLMKVYDADTQTLVISSALPGSWSPQSGAYAPGSNKVFIATNDFGLGSWYIQIVNATTNAFGATIVDGATGALFGYYNLKYIAALNKVLMLGSNGGNADTDALELNPATNAFTRFLVTVAPGGPNSEIGMELDYCPDNNRYYVGTRVTTGLASNLRSFDATSHIQQSVVAFGSDQIQGVRWIADVSRLYVYTKHTATGACKVHVYNVTTDTVETVITLGNIGSLNTVSDYWQNKGLLVLPTSGAIHFIDPQSNTEVCSLASATGIDPFGVAGDNLWAAPGGGALLKVYN